MKSIIGKKVGMTQVFSEDGNMVPVTVIEAGPVYVTQIKTVETDGYNAIQVAFGDAREKLFNKPIKGHFAKSGVAPKKMLLEFHVEDPSAFTLGQAITADLFEAGQMIDVSGTSKGKGTQGAVRRWNQHTGPMSHGSKFKRGAGSLGANSTPARVLKGMHMAGRMGNEMKKSPFKTSNWYELIQSATCCWSKAQFQAPRVVSSLFNTPSRQANRNRSGKEEATCQKLISSTHPAKWLEN